MPGVLGAELSKVTFFGKKLFQTLVFQDVLDDAERLPRELAEVFNCWESCTGVTLFVWSKAGKMFCRTAVQLVRMDVCWQKFNRT